MKRIGLIFILLGFALMLSAQAVVTNIVVNKKNNIVTRVVISLSEKTYWTIDTNTSNSTITLTLKNADATGASITGVSGNSLVSGVETDRGGIIKLNLNGKFFIETLTMADPYRIILDLFVAKVYTFQEHYMQAAFYEEMGKWVSANKEYRKMLAKYPYSKDTHYFYARLLVKQGNKTKAKEHFAAVPEVSKFYKAAQAELAVLEGKTPPVTDNVPVKGTATNQSTAKGTATNQSTTKSTATPPPMARPVVPQPTKPVAGGVASPPTAAEKRVANTTSDQASKEMSDAIAATDTSAYNDIAKVDTLYDSVGVAVNKGKSVPAESSPGLWDKVKAFPLWLWLIIGLILAILVFIILDSLHVRKSYISPFENPEDTLEVEDSFKAEMVRKLLADGWDAREIARELRMSNSEVNAYIKKAQKNGIENEDR